VVDRIHDVDRRLRALGPAALDRADARVLEAAGAVRRDSGRVLTSADRALETRAAGVVAGARRGTRAAARTLGERRRALIAAAPTQAGRADERQRAARRRLDRSPRHLDLPAAVLDGLAGRCRAADPTRLMARGWTLTRDEGGRLVRSVQDVAAGSQIVTILADGDLRSTVGAVAPSVPDHPVSREERPRADP
jgi:exodeoxyribonuclease VII large subunit